DVGLSELGPRRGVIEPDVVACTGMAHERTAVCEDDIRRLIPGLNGGDELSGCDVHDADGVGDVIDDPDLIAAHGKTYRIDADRKFARESERAVTGDIEDREAVVGGVERVELGSIGGQGDGV